MLQQLACPVLTQLPQMLSDPPLVSTNAKGSTPSDYTENRLIWFFSKAQMSWESLLANGLGHKVFVSSLCRSSSSPLHSSVVYMLFNARTGTSENWC